MKDTKENLIERVMELIHKRNKNKQLIEQLCDNLYCFGYQAGYINGCNTKSDSNEKTT